jgi:hypothetical protein
MLCTISRQIAGAALLTAAGVAIGQQTQAAQDKIVRINQLQVIGSHNSYHTGFAPSARKYMESKNSRALYALDYRHAPLADQLTGGVRQIEIDVFSDVKGGRFAHPKIDQAVAAAGLPADPDFDPQHEMDKPGFKVMHVQDIDERSSCHTFVGCLTAVKTWSKQHPNHVPIFILVETKEGDMKEMPEAVKTEPFTSTVFDALDAEIRSVFTPAEMITPDDVRGKASTLEAAVLAGGWPTLAKARGKVVFLMDQHKVTSIYAEGHPSLKGRVLFTNSDPGQTETAFIEQNNGSKETIDALVKKGYLIRTRTDEGTQQARTNDTTRRDLALSTGAQLISTDYPGSEPSEWTGFSVTLPDGLVARCNPVNKPAACVDSLLEPKTNTTAKK